jgi:hypothetical protein
MAGYGTAMKEQKSQKPVVNTCGDCGVEITDSEILCQDCLWPKKDVQVYDDKTILGECHEFRG